MNNTEDVRIERLVYGGDAMGRLADGRAVFIPFVLPGELARIKLVEEKPHYARADLVEVLEPSPQRITARCVHFITCGGCHYQHMESATQLKAKSAILREQLERIGGITEIPTVEIIAALEPWYYRNHISFTSPRMVNWGSKRHAPTRHLPFVNATCLRQSSTSYGLKSRLNPCMDWSESA
jgi:23S rRNA (uracil1939-C5)-methyltransferase